VLTLGPLQLDVPAVMGILNVTPDSFSDGGRFVGRDAALRRAEVLASEGAAIIDIGGESTRPGAAAVAEQEELDRTLPVIEAIAKAVDVPVSVDTSKPVVMREAIRAGAAMINDIRALREQGALQAAVDLQCPVCLMHMQGQPRSMQREPVYGNVVAEVLEFLDQRLRACIAAGLPRDLIVVDPGFGFGKTRQHNIELLSNLRQLRSLGQPILAGLSRKSTLGELTGRGVGDRMPASIVAAALAVVRGASIIRAHDVRETVDALRVTAAVEQLDGDR
jgi:dihydropteroate synthase